MRSLATLLLLAALCGCATSSGLVSQATVYATLPETDEAPEQEIVLALVRFDGHAVFAYGYARCRVGVQLAQALGSDLYLQGPWEVEADQGFYWTKEGGLVRLEAGDTAPAAVAALLSADELAAMPFELAPPEPPAPAPELAPPE